MAVFNRKSRQVATQLCFQDSRVTGRASNPEYLVTLEIKGIPNRSTFKVHRPMRWPFRTPPGTHSFSSTAPIPQRRIRKSAWLRRLRKPVVHDTSQARMAEITPERQEELSRKRGFSRGLGNLHQTFRTADVILAHV